jgi:hypothetical protein
MLGVLTLKYEYTPDGKKKKDMNELSWMVKWEKAEPCISCHHNQIDGKRKTRVYLASNNHMDGKG